MKKKVFLAIVLIIIMLWAILPVSLSKANGVYNTFSQLMWCNKGSCEHEMSHYMDDKMGFPSQDEGFQKAIHSRYTFSNEFDEEILGFNIGYAELYANIFRNYFNHREDVPEVLEPFYDWNIIDRFDIDYINGGFYYLK